jgi:hypothetical protein
MTQKLQTLAELEAAHPEDFQNPPMSDEAYTKMMAENRVRSKLEDARAETSGGEDEDEEDEEDEDE